MSATHSPRYRLTALGAALAVAATLGLTACGDGSTGSSAPPKDAPAAATTTTTEPAAVAALDGDAAAIVFMREEEKLARDVYTVLAEAWGIQTFVNITASEQQHMDAVAGLLDAYGIPDPAATTGPGEFRDPDLQALYDDLVAKGLQSPRDALEVGVIIEETDIADLAERTSTDPTVQAVWDRLTAGSQNHLRAFTTALARTTA